MMIRNPRATLTVLGLVALGGCGGQDVEPTQEGSSAEDALAQLLARAASLELDTEYVLPPGDALHHHTSGFAKVLCSGVFLTGLEPADAAANVGGFTSPFAQRAHVVDTIVDFDRREVRLTLPDGTTRVAKLHGSQGCVVLPIGEDSVFFHALYCRARPFACGYDALAHGRCPVGRSLPIGVGHGPGRPGRGNRHGPA